MQENVITLDVDYLNDANTTAEPYERFEENLNRSVYCGENHTPEARDTITLYRSLPTKSGNFKGVTKTSVKLSRDHQVSGVDGVSILTAPVIWELSCSLPVGVSAPDSLKCRQRAEAMLALQALMDKLNNQGVI